ncbi:Metallo-hydrolase/oxidoreductase [Corynespora cassiicola Philippines]|uniref:Metallo-hydrolase/oxidoreductase n=1 Tax=Corynespora cassiicola Philippines TaxID=1448308 RepID=A0A2T2P9Z2_CORCC|nr:Metallo-hydrolase/oxidoreductase [Corynespora cassiicola Philippines]
MKLTTKTIISGFLSTSSYAQTTNFSEFFNITTFPNQDYDLASAVIQEAREVAGVDMWPHFMHRCIRSQAYPELSDVSQNDGFIEPASPFKNVFFVGQSHWSAWAIDTGNRELLLIDTLASPEEAEAIILPGLEKHGYTGADIKWVIITHEHFDHYAGTRFLQERFEPFVYASEDAWITMANETIYPPLYHNYSKVRTVSEGETVNFNNFSITFHLTPGHTPGTISFFFPVQDHDAAGTPHLAGIYGGGGIPSTASAKVDQVNSFNRFSNLAREVGADVLLSNHQTQDNSLWHFDLLKYRKCDAGGCNLPNPFVVGTDAYARYLVTMGLCVQLKAARDGQELPGSNATIEARAAEQFDHECEG